MKMKNFLAVLFWLFLAGTCHAAVVSHTATGGTADGVTSGGIDTTGANLLIVAVSSYAPGGVVTVSDSNGNTWTPRTEYLGINTRIRLYYSTSTPTVGAGHTFTAGGTGIYPAIAVIAASTAHATAPYDVENGVVGGLQTSVQPGSATPSQNDEILVTAISWDNEPLTMSINSSFTISDQVSYNAGNSLGIGMAYKIQTTLGAENPTWSWGTSADSVASIATFKSLAGGGGTPVRHRVQVY